MATPKHGELEAGAGAVRINPPVGVPLPLAYSGGGDDVVVEGHHDDCWARAVVVAQGETRLAIVAVDICTMRDDQYQEIAARTAARCGIPAAHVTVACTHNHSNAPLLEPFGAPPGPWQEVLTDLIVSAVYQAGQRMQPVSRIRQAAARHDQAAYNRRVDLPDVVCMLIGAEPSWDGLIESLAERLGATRAQLGAPQEPITPNGVVDDLLRLLVFEDSEGRAIASIVSAACHPVTHSFADRRTSADYPGYLVDLAERELGGVALFLQGCSGDVRTRYQSSAYAEVSRLGRQFGSALLRAVSSLAEVPGPHAIAAETREIDLPLKPYQARDWQRARLAEVEQSLDQRAQLPPTGAADIRQRWQLYQESAFLRYQLRWGDLETPGEDLKREHTRVTLQAVKLGRTLLLTSPAEVFAATGIELTAWAKAQGWQSSIVASCTNGYVNYIPPRAEAERGGFEPSCTMLAPGSCELMVDALQQLGQRVAT